MDNKFSSASNSFESLVEMNRLNNLSDGVFAIALTLLAFDLRLPEGVQLDDLPNRMFELGPKFMVYLISFVVIGGAWGAHQRMLNQIKRGDGVLVWFNLLCLLFVALIPATAAILGRYPTSLFAITCFALDVALIQLTTLWLWRHASRQGLINPMLDPRVVTSVGRRLTLSTVVFALSIPLALWSIWITYLFWVGLFILLFTTDWLAWELAARTQQTTFPLDNAKRASIQVQHKEGHLKIDSKAAENIVLDGVFGGGLESQVDRSEDVLNLQLRSAERRGLLSWKYPWAWELDSVLDWTLRLSDQLPIELEIEVTYGRSTLELEALQITDFKIRLDTSEMQISLPDREGTTIVHLESRTASPVIRVPPDVAAHVHREIVMGQIEIDPARFPLIVKDLEYRPANYETAAKRVNIRLAGTMSTVVVT